LAGDTLAVGIEVIGLKQNFQRKNRRRLRTHHRLVNQNDTKVLEYVRWVMQLRKRDVDAPPPKRSCPTCPTRWARCRSVDPRTLGFQQL